MLTTKTVLREQKRQAQQILNKAKKSGLENNYFFSTTFRRYQMQLDILHKLEMTIEEGDTLVKKEYVKGRVNVVTNPAILEFNRTSTAANKTVETLIKILASVPEVTAEPEEDPLTKIMRDDELEEE